MKQKSETSGRRRRPKPIPWERNSWEIRRGEGRERRASDRANKRVYKFRVRFGQKRRASCLPCLNFGLGNDRRGTTEAEIVSLAIFITSVSGSKSLASFTNRFIHLSRPPGFRMAFDAAERNGRFGHIQCQRRKKSSSRGKRKRRVFLCRRTVRVEVIPASFLKIE